MKKIILILALSLIGSGVLAACEDVKCVEPYDLSSSFSRFFSTVTGQKLLAEKIGQGILKKTVKKNIISGKIKSDVKSYSATDLKAGRFKSVKISGKDVNIQGVHISSFEAKTLCNFNYITQDKNGNVVVKEDMPLAISVVMTEDDLNNTMNSSDYKRFIDNINRFGGNLNILNIESTSVQLKDNKMHYLLKYSIPFVRKSKEVRLVSDLRIENGKIQLANTSYENRNFALDIDKFSKILNYINPLDFSAKVLENKEAKLNIENVKIDNDKINISGRITVLKDKE